MNNIINLKPDNWNLSVNGSNGKMDMSADMSIYELFAQICDHYGLKKELLPGYEHYDVSIEWDKTTGHVKKSEDISHHGSSIWEEFASYKLSETDNQILIRMCELIDMLITLSKSE